MERPIGGETEAQVSGWTVDSLHTHLQKQIDAVEKLHEADIEQVRRETAQALANADKAVSKAEAQAEKRFEAQNEFRGQLADQTKTFITRDTYEAHHEALSGRVGVLENLVTTLVAEKRGGVDRVNSIYALGGFVSVVLVVGTVLAANGVFK